MTTSKIKVTPERRVNIHIMNSRFKLGLGIVLDRIGTSMQINPPGIAGS